MQFEFFLKDAPAIVVKIETANDRAENPVWFAVQQIDRERFGLDTHFFEERVESPDRIRPVGTVSQRTAMLIATKKIRPVLQ